MSHIGICSWCALAIVLQVALFVRVLPGRRLCAGGSLLFPTGRPLWFAMKMCSWRALVAVLVLWLEVALQLDLILGLAVVARNLRVMRMTLLFGFAVSATLQCRVMSCHVIPCHIITLPQEEEHVAFLHRDPVVNGVDGTSTFIFSLEEVRQPRDASRGAYGSNR